jgi:hypothetical protein
MNAMKKSITYTASSQLWLYPGEQGNWHFLTLPKAVAVQVRARVGKSGRGFGAIKVEVTIGDTVWQTSIFPDKQSRSYLLPVKAKVRQVEDLWEGETVAYSFHIM